VRRGDLRRLTSSRGAILVLAGAVAVFLGGTRCNSVGNGSPCSQSELGKTSPGAGCQSLVCNGTEFVSQDGVEPDFACNQTGLVCHRADTECDTCTCDGTTFQCQSNCCIIQGCDGGPGPAPDVCPAPPNVVAGQSCSSKLVCPSEYPCEGGTSSACACVSGNWACQCVAAPVALASGENGPASLAIDATNVYWTSYQNGVVRKVAIGGGSPQTIASGQAGPTSIAVDSTSVYWTDFPTTDIGSVMKVPLGGGTPVALASNQKMPYGIAVDAANVYWAAYETVMTMPLGGGTPTMVTAQQPINAFTIDSTNLYWSSYGALSKIALTGGTPVSLAYVQSTLGIAVDATSLYWTEGYGGTVTAVPLAGGAYTSLATGQDGPSTIAVDSTDVYWIDYSGGMVMKVAKTGGATIIVAIGQNTPGNIAVDAVNVYWTGGGNVMMTPK
jgi:hypothetical protein